MKSYINRIIPTGGDDIDVLRARHEMTMLKITHEAEEQKLRDSFAPKPANKDIEIKDDIDHTESDAAIMLRYNCELSKLLEAIEVEGQRQRYINNFDAINTPPTKIIHKNKTKQLKVGLCVATVCLAFPLVKLLLRRLK